METDRDELIRTVIEAMRGAPNLRVMRRRDELDLNIVAGWIIEHLERCGYRWSRKLEKETATRGALIMGNEKPET